MNKTGRIVIVILLIIIVGIVVAMKQIGPASDAEQVLAGPATSENKNVPRLLDMGSKGCRPCDMMAPMLKELAAEYDGRLQVDFIDVRQNPEAGREYNIDLIPTQIFFSAAGEELWRHQGFLSKEDILAKWAELGVSLSAKATE